MTGGDVGECERVLIAGRPALFGRGFNVSERLFQSQNIQSQEAWLGVIRESPQQWEGLAREGLAE